MLHLLTYLHKALLSVASHFDCCLLWGCKRFWSLVQS